MVIKKNLDDFTYLLASVRSASFPAWMCSPSLKSSCNLSKTCMYIYTFIYTFSVYLVRFIDKRQYLFRQIYTSTYLRGRQYLEVCMIESIPLMATAAPTPIGMYEYVYMYICVCMYVCICMCMCMCMCMYACIYICVYIYSNIHIYLYI
jgi:hypothetical protein